MLAPADQFVRHVGVLNVADVRVTIAHATTAYADIFDRVKVLQYKKTFFRSRNLKSYKNIAMRNINRFSNAYRNFFCIAKQKFVSTTNINNYLL